MFPENSDHLIISVLSLIRVWCPKSFLHQKDEQARKVLHWSLRHEKHLINPLPFSPSVPCHISPGVGDTGDVLVSDVWIKYHWLCSWTLCFLLGGALCFWKEEQPVALQFLDSYFSSPRFRMLYCPTTGNVSPLFFLSVLCLFNLVWLQWWYFFERNLLVFITEYECVNCSMKYCLKYESQLSPVLPELLIWLWLRDKNYWIDEKVFVVYLLISLSEKLHP